MSAWRPIADAPKHGGAFLAYAPGSMFPTYYKDGMWLIVDWHLAWNPTHWTNLPAPPTAS